MKRYYVSSYKSPTDGSTVWQVIDRLCGQWIYQTFYKPACVERCKKLNSEAKAVPA